MTPPEGIFLVAGPPGGGKTTQTELRFGRGPWQRVNRDTLGGSLKEGGKVYQEVRRLHAQGARHFVLDNTYATCESRAPAIALAKELGLPISILWLLTNKDQAQFLAALRQVRKYGKLFRKEDYKVHRDDPGMFPPAAQFAYWKRREEPTLDEGFELVEEVAVVINLGKQYVNRALLLDYDGTLRETTTGEKWPTDPGHIRLLEGRAALLQRRQREGWFLLGVSNQSGVSKKPGEKGALTDAQARACFDRTNELLGVDIDYLYAPDRGGVPQTYFRKPCPGMGIVFIEAYKLDPARCICVGDRGEDRTFAARCGFRFADAHDFFGGA